MCGGERTRSVPGGEREIDGDAVIVKFGGIHGSTSTLLRLQIPLTATLFDLYSSLFGVNIPGSPEQ